MKQIILFIALTLCVSSCAQRLGPQAQQWSTSIPSDLYNSVHYNTPIQAKVNLVDLDTIRIPLYCAPCTLVQETNAQMAASEDRRYLGDKYDCAILQGPWCQGYVDISYIDENGVSRRLTVPALLYPSAYGTITIELKDVRDEPNNEDSAVFVQVGG